MGGIVEAAGFGCPLETAHVTAAVDPDLEDMCALALALAVHGSGVTFPELVAMARAGGLFDSIIGSVDDGELGRSEKTSFGRLLTRYDRRLVRDFRFLVEGKGKTRRYKVERVGNDKDDRNDQSHEEDSS